MASRRGRGNAGGGFALVFRVRVIIRSSFPHLFVQLSIDRSGALRLARRAVWEKATVKRAVPIQILAQHASAKPGKRF